MAERAYYVQNPSGVIQAVGKDVLGQLIQINGFEQITNKAIISKVKKQNQSLSDNTQLGKVKTAPTIIEDED